MKTYYEILGISNNADALAIKKAYRELVKKYHPDKNTSEEAKIHFAEIQKAYKVLSDEKKREDYDRIGHQQYTEFNDNTQNYGGYNQWRSQGPSFSSFTSNINIINFKELALWKKVLIIISIIILAFLMIIVLFVALVIKIVSFIFNQIFNRRN